MRIDTFKGQKKELLFWENGDDSKKVKKYMLKHKLTGIVFSKWLGFQGSEITIHELFEFVEEVHIIDSNMADISFIYNFPNVKDLNLQNMDKTKIDFNQFEKLEKLFLTWRKGITNLFNKKSLRSLKLDRFKEKTLEIEVDMLLEELWIINSPIENLFGLSKLKNLKILDLSYLRCLEDSLWLKDLNSLEKLLILSCKKMSNTILDNISGLTHLKKLSLSRMGEIPTLIPIQELKELEIINVIDGSKVVDRNLDFLSNLPNLKEIRIQ